MSSNLADTLEEQIRKIRSFELSSEELVQMHLAQIERLNSRLRAFISTFPEQALRDARAKDRELARARRDGRLSALPECFGIPIGIKDMNFVRGSVSRFGSSAISVWSPVDDASVSRLRGAGFVILGKSATSELGVVPVVEPAKGEPTRNPWNDDRTSGGSSGGAAAAVASGMIPVAHASDGAGSIRIPASFCHLVGFKPSRGVLPNAYGVRDPNVLYTCGPIGRTVGDVTRVLDVWARAQGRFVQAVQRPLRRLTLRYLRHSPTATTEPSIVEVFDRALRLLEGLGHTIEEAPPIEASLEEFLPIWQHLFAGVPFVNWKRMEPITQWLRDRGKLVASSQVREIRRAMSSRFIGWMGEADAIVSPTVPVSPPRIGVIADLPPEKAFREIAPLGAFTAVANLTGQPAVSVPMGLSRDGMPAGIQFMGRLFGDLAVLGLAREFEAVSERRNVLPEGLLG